MPRAKANAAIVEPNLGLYLDRPSLAIPPGALSDGYNFRIINGRITNDAIGFSRFQAFTLNGPVKLIANLYLRDGTDRLVFGTLTDLYRYRSATTDVRFITPIYATGTASASGTTVTGTGTSWTANVKAGDQMYFGDAAQTDPDATWYTVDSVTSDTELELTADAGTVVDGDYTVRQLFTMTFLDH